MIDTTSISEKKKQGFTLIELLVVIAIIAILSIVVVLTLSPGELLRQGRDATRLSDMDTMNRALGLYVTDTATQGSSLNLGNASTVYVSLIDSSSTCGSRGLPALPAGYVYHCSSATSSRLTDGNGWLPVPLKNITTGSPLGSLPVDPQNSSSSGLYYTYVTNGSQYELTSLLESGKYKAQYAANPVIQNYPEVLAQGSSLTLNPLWNPQGLVGYWPMDEGSGSSTIDASGNGNTGMWAGTLGGQWAVGKIAGAGNFNGSNNDIDNGNDPSLNITSAITLGAWVNQSIWNNYPAIVTKGYGTTGGYSLNIRNDNSIWFEMDEASGTRHLYNPSSLIIANNSWMFVTATYDGSMQRVYINGQQSGSGQAGVFTAGIIPSHVLVGYSPSYGYFNGLIDDVRIYNRALSAAEVQALYNAEK